jgi:hypothetical protein
MAAALCTRVVSDATPFQTRSIRGTSPTMRAQSKRGGKRKGAGRPKGSFSPTSRRHRVVVLLGDADHATLTRLAKKARATLGRIAFELVARALRRHRQTEG